MKMASQLVQYECIDTTVAKIDATEFANYSSFALKMMSKMGFKMGSGLGKHEQGGCCGKAMMNRMRLLSLGCFVRTATRRGLMMVFIFSSKWSSDTEFRAMIHQEIFSKVTCNILLCDCWIAVTLVVPTSYPAEKFGFEKQKPKMTLEEKFEGRCIMMRLPIDNVGRELINWVLDKVAKQGDRIVAVHVSRKSDTMAIPLDL